MNPRIGTRAHLLAVPDPAPIPKGELMNSARTCHVVFAALAVWIVPNGPALAQCEHGQSARIRPDDPQFQDRFGESVVLSGESALIGAPWDNESAFHAGAAYAFRFLDDGSREWAQVAKLRASDGAENDLFGFAVARHGIVAAIGAPQADPRGSNSGAAYVSWKIGPEWVAQAKLTPEDGQAGDAFGWSLAVGDRFIVVGARRDDHDEVDSGSV